MSRPRLRLSLILDTPAELVVSNNPDSQPPSCRPSDGFQSSPLQSARREAGILDVQDCVRLPPVENLLPPDPELAKRLKAASRELKQAGKSILDRKHDE